MRNSPGLSSAVLLAESMVALAGRHMPPRWETLSDGLHTRPLPAMHAVLGDCWSHNRSGLGCAKPDKTFRDLIALREKSKSSPDDVQLPLVAVAHAHDSVTVYARRGDFEASRHGIRLDCADVLRLASQPAVKRGLTYSWAA
jgi:hypothetical protein